MAELSGGDVAVLDSEPEVKFNGKEPPVGEAPKIPEPSKKKLPEIGPLEKILSPSIQEDMEVRTVLKNEPVDNSKLTDSPLGGTLRDCLVVGVEPERRWVRADVYRAVAEIFGDRVGKDVEIRLCYKKDVTPVENLEGKGAEVVISEKITLNLEVIYVVDGEFGGIASTGSVKEVERGGAKYVAAQQIIIHDLTSDQATDIRSFILPQTQLRYVPVAADSESSKRYFGQRFGDNLQVENITTPERLAAIFHEVGHERLQLDDPQPSEEASAIMGKAVVVLKLLPKEDLQRLAQLLPVIERGASDEAIELWNYLIEHGFDLGISTDEVKKFLNQGLSAHKQSLREELKDENIQFELYSAK